MTACGPLQVRGKPSDKPERRGGLLGVTTQRLKVKKPWFAVVELVESPLFQACGSCGPYRRERVLTVGPWAP